MNVVDGDTVKVITRPSPHEPWALYSVRIAECDAPEMKGSTDLERSAALAAKSFVQKHVNESDAGLGILQCASGQDKFGRLLGDILLRRPGGESFPLTIGQLVLRAGMGRAYNGGTKDPWSPADLSRIVSSSVRLQ